MSFPTTIDARVNRALAVQEIGIDAAALLSSPIAEIAAVFARTLYLRNHTDWGCVGSPGLGSGPLNLLCALPGKLDWRTQGLGVGDTVKISQTSIRLSPAFDLSLTQSTIWRPDAPAPWTMQSLIHGLKTLDRIETPRPPDQGLGVFGVPGRDPDSPEARRAAPAIQDFDAWLRTALSGRNADAGDLSPIARSLLGLGPGLTPSGDDFLGGTMIALHLVGQEKMADAIWSVARPLATTRTVDVSAAHLRAAAHGRGNEALHQTLNAILCGRDAGISAGLARLDKIGHCSGWDGLAGVLAVLRRYANLGSHD